MVKSKDSILKDYQNSVEIQQSLIKALKKTLNRISLLRLGLFLVEILLVAVVIRFGYSWPVGVLACLPVLAFLAVLRRQTGVQNELDYAERLLFVFSNEFELVTTGGNKYDNGNAFADESHPYAADLDIYGPASLYAFINRSNTINGMQLLAGTLGGPAGKDELEARQLAIRELEEYIQQTFHFRAGLQGHKPEQLQAIEHKVLYEMQSELKFTHRRWLQLYTMATPFISVAGLILGCVYGGVVWNVLGMYGLANATLNFVYLKKINSVYAGFSGSSELLNTLSGTVRWTEEMNWKSAYIRKIFANRQTEILLSKRIKGLSRIIDSFDVRLNLLLAPFFSLLLLWDFRCAIRLNKWYVVSADQLVKGLYAISQLEELISFATVAHNEPDWVFPVVTDGFHFEALSLGHPLIRENKRIVNDYDFGASPAVDIVTGSNMAGKSTFLRTVGINMVLAFSGAPVCAAKMSLSVFNLLTYMRIKDSLNDQTSTFKAELNRLKMILEGVAVLPHPLVLIDEMLRGTNSKDKFLGSKVFIQKMISGHTPALFATHDLQLSEMIDNYPGEIRNYHFDIQLAAGEMNFDYKLKDGACKTFNAALLLKEIGLSFNPDEHG
jgi:hypothetical protein